MPELATFPPPLSRDSIRAAALRWVGVREGDPRLPIATPDRAWCAAFVAQTIREAGGNCPDEWNAARLVDWWRERGIPLPPMCSPYRVGDLVLFARNGGHHVAIVLADDGGPLIEIVSGNTAASPGGPCDCVAIGRRRRAEVLRAARVV